MINAASHQGTALSLEKFIDIIIARKRRRNQVIWASSFEITHTLRVGGVA